MAHDRRPDSTTRRAFVATTGFVGVPGLAGCLADEDDPADDPTDTSDDDDGPNDGDNDSNDGDTSESSPTDNADGQQTVRIRAFAEASTAYTGTAGLATVVDEYVDGLAVEAVSGDGSADNARALEAGNGEVAVLQNWTASEIHRGDGAVGDLDIELAQVAHFYDLPWFFIANDESLETLSDIGPETRISPMPEGAEPAPALERALEHAVDGYERTSASYGRQGEAMNEGRLDVGVGTAMNFDITPGWLQEIAAIADVHVLEVDDATASAWADDERVRSRPVDTDQLDRATTVGEVPAPTISYRFVTRADLEDAIVTDVLETMADRRSELAEQHTVLGYYEDDEFWIENAFDGVPFHPAAADFYEKRGVWRDEFERA